MKKLFTISTVLMAAISASAADVTVIRSGNPGLFMAEGISSNGKFVCGNSSVWIVETDEIISSSNPNAVLTSVSDTGLAVGYCDDFAVKVDAKGDMSYIDGMTFADYSIARGINADGSIIVGSRYDAAFHQEACCWENGTHLQLPVPDVLEDVPDDVEIYGISANGVSDDGNVIVGNIITGTNSEAVVMWTRNESGEYEFHPLYAGLMEFGWEMEKPYINMTAQSVSNNGKWISLVLQLNSLEDLGYYAGRYNIETGEVECAGILNDYSECNYYATGVSNDGTIVGFLEQQESTMYGRRAFVWEPASKNPKFLSAYCDANAGIEEIEDGVASVYTGITGDGTRIIGFSMTQDISDMDSFVIDITGKLTGISGIEAEKNNVYGIYNLHGNRVIGQPTPGIYVVIENGISKKVVVR